MKQLHDALKALPGDYLVIHSSMMGLRRIARSPDAVIEVILSALGDREAIIMPAYTPQFTRINAGDWRPDWPTSCGAIANAFLRYGFRTQAPLNSYTVWTKNPSLSWLWEDIGTKVSWGRDGVMGRLEYYNATFVALGVSFLKSCSYWHRAEFKFGVPYRYFKEFVSGVYGRNGEIAYVGPLGVRQIFWAVPADELLEKWELKERSEYFTWASVRNIVASGLECLHKDPYSLLRNEAIVKEYVESGGIEREIRENNLVALNKRMAKARAAREI